MTLNTVTLLLIAVCCAMGASATNINIVNQCSDSITAFARHGTSATNKYTLAAGAKQQLQVGDTFTAGLVFASKSGSDNNAQATQLEITTNSNGMDFYDVSLVNAYNLPATIQPVGANDDPRNVAGFNAAACGSPTCTISNLQSFCQSPNQYTANGDYCINTDGPGTSATAGTMAFKTACPTAYSYSKDDATSTFSCKTGTDYNFIFCPSNLQAVP